jgi:hypothetical protein
LGGGVLGAGAGELAHVAGRDCAALGECRGELVLLAVGEAGCLLGDGGGDPAGVECGAQVADEVAES